MKSKKINKKLALNKLTVASLATREQQAVKGGYLQTKFYGNCITWHPNCVTLPRALCIHTSPEICIE